MYNSNTNRGNEIKLSRVVKIKHFIDYMNLRSHKVKLNSL